MATQNLGKWTAECEQAVNAQINTELGAFYVYTAMGNYFLRSDVALKNIGKWLLKSADEEKDHAQLLIDYNHKRGGNTVYSDIKAPPAFDANFTALDAMEKALQLEIQVNDHLLTMHKTAEKDPEFSDFIEANFLHEQVDAISELRGYITNLKMCGEGLGTFLFDKNFA